MTDYYMFIDESGDHGLVNIDMDFPAFLLCGVITSADNYQLINTDFNEVKKKYWGDKEVIFHSTDIRKCRHEFQLLFDLDLKGNFYADLNRIMEKDNYTIIATAVDKIEYIKRYGKITNDIYQHSLSFLVERAIFYLDSIKGEKRLIIVIEKRGKREDRILNQHFQKIHSRGTAFINSDRMKALNLQIVFRDKKSNVNGLQMSDLVAYPIIRHVMNRDRANPAFDLIKHNIYRKGEKMYGLKTLP